MKKIKLIAPMLGLAALSGVVIPFSSCSCGGDATTRTVEIEGDLKGQVTSSQKTSGGGNILITLSCTNESKRVKTVEKITIGNTELTASQWSFDVDTQVITISRGVLEANPGVITVRPSEVEDKPIVQSISVTPIKSQYSTGETFDKNNDVKVEATVKQGEETRPVDVTSKCTYTCDGVDLTKAFTTAGSYTIKVTYQGKEQTYGITVVSPTSKITITFVTGEGEGAPTVQPQEIQPGGKATRPDEPVWYDHLFMDWYTDTTHQTKFDFNQAINANTTVYAWYKEATVEGVYGVSYIYLPKTNSFAIDTNTYAKGTELVVPSTHKDPTLGELPVTQLGKIRGNECVRMTGLEKVYLPDNTITTIDDGAFAYNETLKSINSEEEGTFNIPSSVKNIGSGAFSYCDNLEHLYIPETVEYLGPSIAKGTNALTAEDSGITNWKIAYLSSKDNPHFAASRIYEGESSTTNPTDEGAVVLHEDCKIICKGWLGDEFHEEEATAFKLPKVERICDGAFEEFAGYISKIYYDDDVEDGKIMLPESITYIGASAFNGETSEITKIDLSSTHIVELNDAAFLNDSEDSAVTELELPTTIEKIGHNVVSKLDPESGSFELPATLKEFTSDSFNNTNLTITISEGNEYLTYDEGNRAWYQLGEEGQPKTLLFVEDPTIETFVVPSSIETIHSGAFDRCCNTLQEVSLPQSLKYIDDGAFYGCDQLRTIDLGVCEYLISIGDYAFCGCLNLPASITIPDNVTTIGDEAFENCPSLQHVIFGSESQLSYLGSRAFANSHSLQEISIPKGVKSLQESTFADCTLGDGITFAAEGCELESIEKEVFGAYTTFTSIEIPASVVSIEPSAFNGCSSLNDVTFEEGSKLSKIGDSAFAETGITEITIPKSTKIIDIQAFNGCSSLTTVSVEEDSVLESIGSYAFASCEHLTKIQIPVSVKHIGSSLLNGSNNYVFDADHNPFDDKETSWTITGGSSPITDFVPNDDYLTNIGTYLKSDDPSYEWTKNVQ